MRFLFFNALVEHVHLLGEVVDVRNRVRQLVNVGHFNLAKLLVVIVEQAAEVGRRVHRDCRNLAAVGLLHRIVLKRVEELLREVLQTVCFKVVENILDIGENSHVLVCLCLDCNIFTVPSVDIDIADLAHAVSVNALSLHREIAVRACPAEAGIHRNVLRIQVYALSCVARSVYIRDIVSDNINVFLRKLERSLLNLKA